MKQLGHLEQVDLRTVWPSESGDFTPWLGHEANIQILSDTIGIELEVDGLEKNVGPYRADILCKDTGSDHLVLIENQIEKTNHTHLGQILTYPAGLNAVTIVWVAQRFTDEHRAALDWLNEVTTEGIDFFGLEIELWKIGDSAPAPKFNIVSRPNEWTKAGGKTASVRTADLTPTKQLQLNYWTELRAFLEDANTPLKPQKPAACHWMNFAMGTSAAYCCAIADTVAGRIAVRMQLNKSPNRLPLFHHLEESKEAIEAAMGCPILWEEKPEKHTSHLTIHNEDFDPEAAETWEQQFAWLQSTLEAFREHVAPRVKAFLK